MKRISKLLAVFFAVMLMLPTGVSAATVRVMENHRMVTSLTPTYQSSAASAQKVSTAIITFNKDVSEIVLPVNIKAAGLLSMKLQHRSDGGAYAYLECDLYADEACTDKIGYSLDLVYGEVEQAQRSYWMKQSGKAYLKLTLKRQNASDTVKFYLDSELTPGADRSLKADTAVLTAFDTEDTVCRYKITVEKAGYLTFTVSGTNEKQVYAYLTLSNSKKKAISAESCVIGVQGSDGTYTASKTYMVSKGTYYIDADMKGARAQKYLISYSLTTAKDESGTSKAKAAVLVSGGKAKSGMLTQTSKVSNTDWYKVILKKSGNIVINVDAVCDGAVMLQVTDATGKGAWYGSKRFETGSVVFDTGELPKGTYYVKVIKTELQSSAGYTIGIE